MDGWMDGWMDVRMYVERALCKVFQRFLGIHNYRGLNSY